MNLKKLLKLINLGIIIPLALSLFFNLRLANKNYDRITCKNGIAEYFKRFESDCDLKIEKRF